MRTNIEIKARVDDMDALRARVRTIATAPMDVLHQEDVFFHAPRGRLKLRIFDSAHGELIAYERPDAEGPKASHFQIVPTHEPARLRALLTAALGEAGVVIKRRELHMVQQTRVHLDEVDRLGSFMELEVVLAEGDSPEQGTAIAHELMSRLEIPRENLIAGAYFDLLQTAHDRP